MTIIRAGMLIDGTGAAPVRDAIVSIDCSWGVDQARALGLFEAMGATGWVTEARAAL